jgi:hypothetical protein
VGGGGQEGRVDGGREGGGEGGKRTSACGKVASPSSPLRLFCFFSHVLRLAIYSSSPKPHETVPVYLAHSRLLLASGLLSSFPPSLPPSP